MPDDASIEVMLDELDNHPQLTAWECRTIRKLGLQIVGPLWCLDEVHAARRRRERRKENDNGK